MMTPLAHVSPDLIAQWHPTLNGERTPHNTSYQNAYKAWWTCDKGHTWQSRVTNRFNGKGCPYCANKKVCLDNCLATTHPELAKQWHTTKNGKLTPNDVVLKSNKKVWWCCPDNESHVWFTSVHQRASGYNCPYCANKKVCVDNCLATRFPDIAKQWHPTKNDISAGHVTFGSIYKAWWKCKRKGHVWQRQVRYRTRINIGYRDIGCPKCNKRGQELIPDIPCSKPKRQKEHISLLTRFPEIAAQWHPTRNGSLTPSNVSYGSGKKVWWVCRKKHEWLAPAVQRTTGGCGCPYCAGQRATENNCLAKTRPVMACEWHPTKNKNATPINTMSSSRKDIWWKCKHGHEWRAKVFVRTRDDQCCPYCARVRPSKEYCFAVLYPRLIRYWHPTMNGNLTPWDVLPRSSRKVWWRCESAQRHSWQDTVGHKARGDGCPICRRVEQERPIIGACKKAKNYS